MNNHVDDSSHLVLRVRLGIDYHQRSLEPRHLMEAVATRLQALGEELDVELDLLQVSVAGDPRWQGAGPENRVGRPVH